ncbi:DJ-1/PfpI family protein [Rugamonas sp.]|uniref:GlxA family transcriptional regulator n=1 Tax=Rugamonas sp. TaxID=1926287 RepID=UPI0025DA7EBB|nr:DJ-1/PfpI family protein [Rugamonas sp.]
MTNTVTLLAFPGVQSLDVSGPLDVFAEANRFLAPQDHYRIEVLGVERGLMACSNGLQIQAQRHFSDSSGALDLLLVAGGPSLLRQDFGEELNVWLRAATQRARRYGSICNGALLLARAGLLDHKHVTTHWNDAAALGALCPTARVESDRLFIQDGALYTSAGVTAGIDLSLFLLAQDHGGEVALNVAKRLVVFTQRAGGQSQFSPFLTPYVEATSAVAQVQDHVLSHLAQDLSVAVLAGIAGMSTRSFSRVFVRDAGATPAEFVESARVDAARVMLENSALPLKTVAYQCGLRDAQHLRDVFKRRLGVSAQQYRLHFGIPREPG